MATKEAAGEVTFISQGAVIF